MTGTVSPEALMPPVALKELARGGALRDLTLVYSDAHGGWLLRIYHAMQYRYLRLWDRAEPRVFRDIATAVRHVASLKLPEIRIDLSSWPAPSPKPASRSGLRGPTARQTKRTSSR